MPISDSGVGTATRLENFMKSLEEKLSGHVKKKTPFLNELEQAGQAVDKPFEYATLERFLLK